MRLYQYAILWFFISVCSYSCTNMRTIICPNAPKAIGPYSHAVIANGFVFCSGQIGLDPKTGNLAGEDIESQTHQLMKNLRAVLQTSGSDLSHATKLTVFLTDLANFTKVNEIYGDYFGEHRPARSTVQVSRLPKGALIEIECIAIIR